MTPPALLNIIIAKDVATAEQQILNPENEGNPALMGPIGIFNRYSDKPYMYLWGTEIKKRRFRKDIEVGAVKKINLPVINGKQVTAKDVWFTAQEAGKTIEEILIMIGATE